MAKLRLPLHLALALLCASLICDLTASRAIAGLGGSCCESARESGTADGGLAGIGMLPGVPEPAGTTAKGERFAAAATGTAAAQTARGLSPAAAMPARHRELAAATPLYLSHCAFLC